MSKRFYVEQSAGVDRNGIPLREMFAFGLYECAMCGANCFGSKRRTRKLKEPVWADFKKTEILIPAGRQSFHRECLRKLEAPQRPSKPQYSGYE